MHEQALNRFLERIRKSFSHDLRTPLGTIVNYAAVLEASQGIEVDEVRDLGRRIRLNALRAARMVQLIATASGLAGRTLSATSTDLGALARSVLAEAGGRGEVHVQPGSPSVADIDAEILGFAWRAYVAVESDVTGTPIHSVALEIRPARGGVSVELCCGGQPSASASTTPHALVEVPSYLRFNEGPARLESSMGLGLAQDLVEGHGGDFGVWGRPGIASGLRVRLPARA